MPEIVIRMGDDGKFEGLGPANERAWARWRRLVAEAKPGDTLRFSYKLPRSPEHHRALFAQLSSLLNLQEQFTELKELRLWATVGAGHCRFVPGPTGVMVPIPESIDFESLDEAEFTEFHRRFVDFLRSPRLAAFLWPHLPDEARRQMVELVLEGRA